MHFRLTAQAERDLDALDRPIQKRIIDKLEWFESQEDPISFAEPLAGMQHIFRYRIGAYRVLVSPQGAIIAVLRVRKRSEAYR